MFDWIKTIIQQLLLFANNNVLLLSYIIYDDLLWSQQI